MGISVDGSRYRLPFYVQLYSGVGESDKPLLHRAARRRWTAPRCACGCAVALADARARLARRATTT